MLSDFPLAMVQCVHCRRYRYCARYSKWRKETELKDNAVAGVCPECVNVYHSENVLSLNDTQGGYVVNPAVRIKEFFNEQV